MATKKHLYNDVQSFRLGESYRHAQQVLGEIKQRKLTGSDLEKMKLLENIVSLLEIVMFGTR